jgi:hypothetical protein
MFRHRARIHIQTIALIDVIATVIVTTGINAVTMTGGTGGAAIGSTTDTQTWVDHLTFAKQH